MSIKSWSGAALGLALCTTALTACSVRDTSNQSAEAPASPEIDGAWKSDTEQQLRDAIEAATTNGLQPELFLKGGEKGASLTQAALKYASALANGYTDPKKLHDVYTIPHEKVDVRQGLQQALQKGDMKGWLASLAPQTDEYRALGEAYVHFGQLASKVKYQPIPDGKAIKPGESDPRMPQIVAALSAVGYLPAAPEVKPGTQQPAAASTTYSPAIVAAVKKVQGDFGFKQDGIIGGDTLDAVNADPAYRAREIAVAMERLRWLQRTPPATRIDVNTASAVLQYWRDGKLVDTRNVVVGEHDKPTPQLQAPIFRLVAKPTWTVPKGIGEKELADKGQQWLAENDFVRKDGLYVQQSGPKNSLGLVKFDMQDDQAIYLHDTPAKALFSLPERHRSHGCVRVQNAVQFATMLAADAGIQDEFQQAMQKETDQNFVKMPKDLPVRLLYHTVFWDGSAVRFRPDLYGWDENIARALDLAPGPPHKIRQPQSSDDVGP